MVTCYYSYKIMYVRYSECIKDTCYFFWDTFYMRGEREIQILNIFIRNTKKKKNKTKNKKKNHASRSYWWE